MEFLIIPLVEERLPTSWFEDPMSAIA
jgi:hypothetical protein